MRWAHCKLKYQYCSNNFAHTISNCFWTWNGKNIILRFRTFTKIKTELTHFSSMSHFYTPWKRQKTLVLWRFQGLQKCGIELKWVNVCNKWVRLYYPIKCCFFLLFVLPSSRKTWKNSTNVRRRSAWFMR